jgi:uncharacterized protein
MRWRRARWPAGVGLAVVLLPNLAAYQAARTLTHFTPSAGTPDRRGTLSLEAGLRALRGAGLPRTANAYTPARVGLAYERHVFTGPDGTAREAWYVPLPRPRAVVALFHGYRGCKSDLLREARAFHAMGLAPLLVDLRGAGGSGGETTSIGYHEADDVAAAAAYARTLPGRPPLVLYGASMGAAAVLKAESERPLTAVAVVAEEPFNRLLTTVELRFQSRRLPAFPWAQLLVFWGGVQGGFDGFHHDPAEYARRITTPTLLVGGEEDPWVRVQDTREIFDALAGPKELALCPGVAHQLCLRAAPEVWLPAVQGFLDRYLPAAPAAGRTIDATGVSGAQCGGRASS